MFTMLNKILCSYTIRLWKIYSTEEGKEPFRDWLDSLKDVDTQALIFQRLQRIKLENFGDCKPISEGLWE